MTKVIGIRFQNNGNIYSCETGDLNPNIGDYVIVEMPYGIDLGEVAIGILELDEKIKKNQTAKIVRMATTQDIQRATENRNREREAYQVCNQKIQEHNLEMKLVSVEVLFDNSKMLFYFTANGRVDFRALVKDLAAVFRTRIELRQIGVRDEARMLGGLGPCGRPICCGTFLNDFQPVSIKMAKEQNLSLNPTKISGVCGRLMCCLKYEQDQYEQTRKRMPKVGREVITPDGIGVVSDLNIVKETVSVRIPNGDATEIKEYALNQISRSKDSGYTDRSDNREKEENIDSNDGLQLKDVAEDDGNIICAEQDEEMIPASEEINEEKTKRKKQKQYRRENRSETDAQKQNAEEGNRERKSREQKNSQLNKKNNSGKAKEQTLGQPVRRENPNKAATIEQNQQNENDYPEKDILSNRSKNWAAAVEKALMESESFT